MCMFSSFSPLLICYVYTQIHLLVWGKSCIYAHVCMPFKHLFWLFWNSAEGCIMVRFSGYEFMCWNSLSRSEVTVTFVDHLYSIGFYSEG